MPSPPVPDAVLALIRRHLATAAAPIDPVTHLATYSDEAILAIGTAVVHRRGIDPARYADHWQQTLIDHPDVSWGGPLTLVDVLDWQAAADGGRLAAIVSDAVGRPWTTAWLIEGDPPRLRAVCLSEGPLPGPEMLLAQACGDLAQWGANAAGNRRFLSPLGISLHLHTQTDDLPLVSLPEARFTCQGRGDCCQSRNWDITVSVNTRVALDGMPWQELGMPPVRIERAEAGYLRFAAKDDGACLALEGQTCGIHRALGRQPIPVCQVYPFHFTATPDAIAVTAAFTCLTVGNNQGEPLLARLADVQGRLRLGRGGLDTIPDPVRLWPQGPPLAWQAYKAVEACLLDTLADRSRGELPVRVLACSRGMAELAETALAAGRCPDDPVAVVRTGMDRPRSASPLAADILMDRLLRDRPWEPVAMRPFGGWLRHHWQISRSGRLGDGRDDELATRYLRTVLFRKPGLATGGALFTWGLTAWTACLWDRQTLYQHRRDRRAIDRDLQLDTARRLDYLLLNAHLSEWMETEPSLRQMVSNPATWLALSAASG